MNGRLIVVGTGIQLVSHMTLGAKSWIEQADKVLFGVADPAAAEWLQTLNPTAESLQYDRSRERRRDTYDRMVDQILQALAAGGTVCAVFYGHPGVFVYVAHAAMRQARAAGYEVQMLPGVSAEDCLVADLEFDPARYGCQSFEATDFLIRRRRFDPSAALILWQIAFIGNLGFYSNDGHVHGLTVLAEELSAVYGPAHEVVVYEAAVYPVCPPVIVRVSLAELPQAPVSTISTLYVPPKAASPLDEAMMTRLNMTMPKP